MSLVLTLLQFCEKHELFTERRKGSIVATVNALLDLRGRMSSIPLGRVIKSSRTAVRSDGSDRWTVINEDDVGREVSRITVSFVEHEGASREPIPTEETVRNGDRSGQTSRYIYVPKREAGLADEVVADDQDVKSGDEFVEESDAPSLSGEESVGEMKDMEIGEEEPAVDDTDEMSSNEEKVEVGHTDKRQKVTGSTTTFNRRKRGTRFTGLSYAESTDEEEDKLTDEEEDKLTDEEEDRRGLALDVHEI